MKRIAIAMLVGCGPAVGGDADETSSGSTDPSTSDAPTGPTSADSTASTTTTATTTDPDTTGVDSGDDSSSGSPFIQVPDGGGWSCTVELQCDPWAQDCPRGEKCVPASCPPSLGFTRTACRPIADDPVPVGSPCTAQDDVWSGIDDCELGSVCSFLDDALEGTCVAQCTGSEANPQCPAGHSCDVGFDGTATLCLPECDPLAPACGAEQTCAHGDAAAGPNFEHFVCQSTATTFAIGEYGHGCDLWGNLCAPGLACVWEGHVPTCEASQCCTVLGELASPPPCPSLWQTCIAAYPDGDAPMGLEDLCYCGVEA